ncbi:MAG: DUF3352 domain-containing protein [Anaerolineae bacterium]|nr:DUF3352 domain-containing protein [Anaerolineae bacterium]
MRKLALSLLFTLVILGLSVVGIGAAPADSGALAMAQYFPQETVLFLTMRTDEAIIDDLDRIITTTLANAPLPPEVPMMTLRQALDMGLQQANLELADIYAWLGNGLALGLTSVPTDGSDPDGYVVLEITDRAALESFIAAQTQGMGVEPRTEGAYTVYSSPADDDAGAVLVGDDLVLVLLPGMAVPEFPLATSLLANSAYQAAVAELPADSYNLAAYVDVREFIPADQLDDLQIFGMSANSVNPMMVGLTLLDNYSLVMDVVQIAGADGGNPAVARLDPGFLKFIPTDASAVIHGTDLTGAFNQLSEVLTTAARQTDTPSPITQIEAGLQSLGFDLQQDILSWTTGDYALFLRTNIRPIVQDAINGEVSVDGNFDAGLLIEATNPEAAKTFAAKLGTLISTVLRGQESLEIKQAELEGVAVTSITVTAPVTPQNTVSLTVVIGASDDIFFIATQDAAGAILRGEGGLDSAEAYQQASKYLLPNPTAIWYTDGEGFITGVAGTTVGFLALLGPAIGNVFENITDELEAPSSSNPLDLQPIYVQTEDPSQQLLAVLDYAIRVLGSSSISSTISPTGASVIRFVITLNPQ